MTPDTGGTVFTRYASRITSQRNVFQICILLYSGLHRDSPCQAASFSGAPTRPSRSNPPRRAGSNDPVPELRDVRDPDQRIACRRPRILLDGLRSKDQQGLSRTEKNLWNRKIVALSSKRFPSVISEGKRREQRRIYPSMARALSAEWARPIASLESPIWRYCEHSAWSPLVCSAVSTVNGGK